MQTIFFNSKKAALLDLKVISIVQTRIEIIVVVEKALA